MASMYKLLKIMDSMYNKAKCRVKWKGKAGDKIDIQIWTSARWNV